MILKDIYYYVLIINSNESRRSSKTVYFYHSITCTAKSSKQYPTVHNGTTKHFQGTMYPIHSCKIFYKAWKPKEFFERISKRQTPLSFLLAKQTHIGEKTIKRKRLQSSHTLERPFKGNLSKKNIWMERRRIWQTQFPQKQRNLMHAESRNQRNGLSKAISEWSSSIWNRF